jgi:hypothetical protein
MRLASGGFAQSARVRSTPTTSIAMTTERASEFLLRVREEAGVYVATCQPTRNAREQIAEAMADAAFTGQFPTLEDENTGAVERARILVDFVFDWTREPKVVAEGHGSTALAACYAALANSQVQDMTGTQVAEPKAGQ